MPPPTIPVPSEPQLLTPVPLTPESFAPYGTAITIPLPSPSDLTSAPPQSQFPSATSHQPAPTLANQGFALKFSPISKFEDRYAAVEKARGVKSKPLMSVFSSFPRPLRRKGAGARKGKGVFDVRILERHPYTTQTFSPLGLAGTDPDTYYLVIVAPTLEGTSIVGSEPTKTIHNPPDLANVKAFVARGDTAVTYGVGTWHAPMAVIGRKRVDFVVSQFANGVGEDDCQEVVFGERIGVEVEVEDNIKARL